MSLGSPFFSKVLVNPCNSKFRKISLRTKLMFAYSCRSSLLQAKSSIVSLSLIGCFSVSQNMAQCKTFRLSSTVRPPSVNMFRKPWKRASPKCLAGTIVKSEINNIQITCLSKMSSYMYICEIGIKNTVLSICST